MITFLLIDDDTAFTAILSRRLHTAIECDVHCYISPVDAMQSDLSTADVILLDMQLGQNSGLDAIATLKQRFTPEHLIMLTGYASIATTVEAMKRGATDYLAKPVSLSDILTRIDNASQRTQVEDFTPLTPAQVEREHIERVLQTHGGNISATAAALKMHRRTLQRKLQKFTRGE